MRGALNQEVDMGEHQQATSLTIDRRTLLSYGAAAAASLAVGGLRNSASQAAEPAAADNKKPTQFQIACMTLPYSQFPLDRALSGIKAAGYKYVAWGTTHKEEGQDKNVPNM